MTTVSVERVSKMVSHFDEVHVTTALICVYRDYQFVKIPKLKYIVGYLPINVNKAPSCTSRKKSFYRAKKNLSMIE